MLLAELSQRTNCPRKRVASQSFCFQGILFSIIIASEKKSLEKNFLNITCWGGNVVDQNCLGEEEEACLLKELSN